MNSETAFTPVSGSIAPSTTSIIWKHRNNAGIVVKVIEWDRDDGSFDIPNANFKSHARLDKDTGELTLRNLQLKHTGVYTIDIDSKEQRKQFSLTVKGELMEMETILSHFIIVIIIIYILQLCVLI